MRVILTCFYKLTTPMATPVIEDIKEGPPNLPDSKDTNITITLSAFEWNSVLNELWDRLRVCNRDNSETIRLYEKLATILNNGNEIHILHRDNLDPKYRPLEEKKPAPAPAPNQSWWRRKMTIIFRNNQAVWVK